MPCRSSAVTAYDRHWPLTGHIAQMRRASAAGPSLGGKKISGSAPTQSAWTVYFRAVSDLASASSCGESITAVSVVDFGLGVGIMVLPLLSGQGSGALGRGVLI